MQPSRNRQYIIIDSLMLILSVLILFILIFAPTITNSSDGTFPIIVAILILFPQNIFATITLIAIVASFIGIGIMPALRLLNINLIHANRNPTPAAALIYLFRLARTNTENDTAQLGFVLIVMNIVSMLALNLFTINSINLELTYTFIFILGTLPLGILSALYLPIFRSSILGGGGIIMGRQPYLSVEAGRLIGAQPRLDPQKLFYIGKHNDANLVLFDEYYASDNHLCVYFDNNNPMVVAYEIIYLNNQPLQINVAYPLKPGDELQIGQTKIKFKV